MADSLTLSRLATRADHSASGQDLIHIVEHAAHLLPSQGPMSVFVHHNTLHAYEDLPFAEAVSRGSQVYGCQAYLGEDRYRQELARGRIRNDDLAAVLQDDLGNAADELIGLLGTRFHLRLAMLEHALHSAPSAELRWVIAETDALRRFRDDVPVDVRQRVVESTRRWIMRDFRDGSEGSTGETHAPKFAAVVSEALETYGKSAIEDWSESTWESFCLQILWRICCVGVTSASSTAATEKSSRRPRDILLEATGQDSDDLVHAVLIRYCAAFLDQGFAHWRLPNRDQGFFASFIAIYGEPGGVAPHWQHGLREELQRLRRHATSAIDSLRESLELLGVAPEHREAFVTSTLLALRGWSGMIWQMETNAEWAVRPAPRGTLVEYLAVRLLLERCAAAYIAREELNFRGPLSELTQSVRPQSAPIASHGPIQRAFLFFQLAQALGLRPVDLHNLPAMTWARLAAEIDGFSEVERRRIFHLAYERRYRNRTLDAIEIHNKRWPGPYASPKATPDFQLVCCIDEREESFRRHVEEIHPECETLSYAGFFGVAMYYRGAAEAHERPLCPVVIKPKHYVHELPVYTFAESHRKRARRRRLLGAAAHGVHWGSRSMIAGAVTALFGSIASIPLVGRVLLPRTAPRVRRLLGRIVDVPPVTELLLERTKPEPGQGDGAVGYAIDEMVGIVERVLRDFGLTSGFAPLVIICGHGSSSLNNPHESAHDCGACGGGRGGPNARAFSRMANDPRVRDKLARRGLEIPAEVAFVGAYHNTCDDSMTFYDLDRLAIPHRQVFERARAALDVARQRNAHERCRRFESAPLSLTPELALRHVEARAEDLAQVRPEYGHATNAVCVVGRRSRTRGLYMDRRSFLASYDPTQDDEQCTTLTRILGAVIPVCAGINLEYYFSFTDPTGWGCGTKLPHNITSLLGVMDGAASDLRPGLPWQMVEVHEPVRLLFVIETTPSAMLGVLERNPPLATLVRNDWVQLATLDPHSGQIDLFRRGAFEPYLSETSRLPQVACSTDWYRGWRDHLGYAEVVAPPAPNHGVANGDQKVGTA